MNLVSMYVYFDKKGDIKAITPAIDSSVEDQFTSVTFPLTEVEQFLVGQRNLFDYHVKHVKTPLGNVWKILRKVVHIDVTRSLDTYLTKVPTSLPNTEEPSIRVICWPDDHEVKILLNKQLYDVFHAGAYDEESNIHRVIGSGNSAVYITAEDNPFALKAQLSFNSRGLFESGSLTFKIDESVDLRKCSVYTKKIITGYIHIIKD